MATAAAPIAIDLGASWGAATVGNYIAMALLAYQLAQTLYYFMHYPNDRWWMKAVAVLLLGVTVAQQMETTKAIWLVTITHFGSLTFGLGPQPDLLTTLIFTAIATVIVQAYFIRRIFQFSQNRAVKWGVPAILIGPMLYTFAGYITYAFKGFPLGSTQYGQIRFIGVANQTCTSFVDVVIALTMVVQLNSRRTGMGSNGALITRLIVMSVNSGLWTAILAVVNTVLLIGYPDKLWYCITFLPLTAIYANSLLGNWNVRNHARAIASNTRAAAHSGGSSSAGQVSQSISMKHLAFAAPTDGRTQVKIETETVAVPDVDIYGKDLAHGYGQV